MVRNPWNLCLSLIHFSLSNQGFLLLRLFSMKSLRGKRERECPSCGSLSIKKRQPRTAIFFHILFTAVRGGKSLRKEPRLVILSPVVLASERKGHNGPPVQGQVFLEAQPPVGSGICGSWRLLQHKSLFPERPFHGECFYVTGTWFSRRNTADHGYVSLFPEDFNRRLDMNSFGG